MLALLYLPPESQSRARVFAITAWLAFTLCGVSAVLALASGLTVLAALNAINVLVSALVLRRLDAQPQAMVRLFLWTLTLTLTAGALATTPMEPTMLGYLFVLPLVAATMLDERETKHWFFRVMAMGAAATLAGGFGFTVQQVDPLPLVNQVLNFVATLVAAMALLRALARERDRAEERVREAERARAAFFANISHEIRTPMNGVLGMTDALLLRDLRADEREMAQTIHTSGVLMLSLLDDLLDLSKLEAGRLTLEEGPVSLPSLANELRALWTPAAKKKQLELTVELDASAPETLKLDGRRLRQILGNLVSNALKFTQTGAVRVVLARANDRLVCSVTDTGIGISPEQHRRLFERFVQADDARARRYQGSGLGLALSRELAQLMGGTLEVESEPGVGSRFTCTLPLVEVAAAPPRPEREGLLPAGLRVLVVDDNAVNRLVAQRLLGLSGCEIDVASDGHAAMEVLARKDFDVVLLDVHMPELDGLEVTRRIRASPGAQPRIIGVSASADSDDVRSCREAGMNDFLAKPVTRERLIETLQRQVGH